MERKTLRNYAADAAVILLGCGIFSVGFVLFLEPYYFNAGGLTGLAMAICHYAPMLSLGLVTFLLNIPLFVAGYRGVGRGFFFGSLLGMLVSSLLLDVFALLPVPKVEPVLSALFGGMLIGVGSGLVFRRNASTGGVDILIRLLKLKFRNLSMGRLMLTVDLVIITITLVVFQDLNKALYSVVALYVSSILMDGVIYGFDYSKVALIVSEQYDAIAAALQQTLSRGVTLLSGRGGYNGSPKQVVLCAIKRHQVTELKELVTNLDPSAFIILQEAHQVLGDGFDRYSKDEL